MNDPHLVADGFEKAVESFEAIVDKFAKSVQLLAAISGMNAENKQRENLGHSVAYGEEAFDNIVKDYQ